MSSTPFYQRPTMGRKIVHPVLSALYWVAALAFWVFVIIGAPVLVELITRPILGH